MRWFKTKEEKFFANLREEQVYELVAHEIEIEQIRPGLWAKAFSEASGDEQLARAKYIKLRAEQVKLGIDVTEQLLQTVFRSPSPHKQPAEPSSVTPEPESSPLRPQNNRGAAFVIDEDKLRQAGSFLLTDGKLTKKK
jgi:hypothetical protein